MIFLLRPGSRTNDDYEKIANEYADDLKARYVRKRYTDFQDMENEDNPVELFKQKIREHREEAYFIAYSHGSEQSLILTTHGEILGISDCDILRNKSCYLVACHAMTGFAPELIRAGARAVLAYRGEFWSYINRNDPDNLEGFKNCINDGIIIFLDSSGTIEDVFGEIKNLYLEIKREIEEKASTTVSELLLLGIISWNMSKLDFLPKS